MPNKKSAKKALRQNIKRRARNRAQRSALRTFIKKFRRAVAQGDLEAARTLFPFVTKKLDQAAAKHLIHKNAAARTKSRLARLLNEASSTATS